MIQSGAASSPGSGFDQSNRSQKDLAQLFKITTPVNEDSTEGKQTHSASDSNLHLAAPGEETGLLDGPVPILVLATR